MKKRFLASLLSLVMLLTMLPMTAFAATGDAYTIKFVAGTDATGTMADQTVAKAESGATSYPIPVSTFGAPTGKVFGEWTITAPADTADLKVENGVLSIPDTLETSQDITLIATWRDPANNEYVINFEAGEGGTGTMTCQPVVKTADAATEYTLPECAFGAPADKEFKAWEVTAPADSGLSISNGKLTIPDTVTVATTITLTATWETASTPPSDQEITEVAVTLDTDDLTVDSALPEAGTDTEGATVSTKWYTAAGEEVKTTTFAAAGDYTAKITVAADAGYKLATDATYTLNGGTAATLPTDGVISTTATVTAVGGGEEPEPVDVTLEKSVPNTITDAGLTITGENDDTAIEKISVSANGEAKVKVTVKDTYVVTAAGDKVTVTSGAPTTASGVTTTVYTLSAAQTGAKVTFTVAEKNDETSGEITLSKGTDEDANITVLPEKATMTNGTATVEITVAAGRELVAPTSDTFNVAIGTPADNKYTVTITLKDGVTTFPATAELTFTTSEAAPAPANAYTIKFKAGGGEGEMADVTVPKAESGPTKYTLPTLAFTAPEGKEFDAWSWLNGIDLIIDKGILTIKEAVPTDDPIILTALWKPAVQKRYIVIAEGITNGTVTTNPPAGVVAVGTEVTVIATPADGYKLGAITVVDYQKNPVAVTGDKFTMPNSDVTVSATFVKEISITEEGDVSTDGNVTADIKPSEADLTAKIEEAKKATGDNQAVTFEVTVSEADKAKAETANVTLSKAAVKSVSDENLAVIVKTPVATVTVPAATMKDITSKADGTNVKMVIDKPKTADVPTDVTHVGGFDVRFEDSKGEVTVNKPLKLKMKVNTTASKVFVYLYKAGKAYFLDSATKQYDVVGGFVEFEVKHLSTYVAQAAKNDDATADKTPSVVTPLGLSIAKDTNGNHGLLTVTGTKANTPYLVQFKAGTSADATCMINVITATDTSFELYTTEPTATNSFVVEVWELKSADEPFVGKFGVANAVEPMVYGGKLFKAFGSGEEIK